MEAAASPTKAVAQRQPASATSTRGAVLQRKCACGGETHGGGECDSCRKKRLGTLQRWATDAGGVQPVSPLVYDVLRQPGDPLDVGTRATMESRFGYDFSGVRLHSDPLAARAAAATGAHAFTVGNHVVLGQDHVAPHHARGERLLAHELAHVVQQRGAPTSHGELTISTDAQAEAAADTAASRVVAGAQVGDVGTARPGTAQRDAYKWLRSKASAVEDKIESGVETAAIKAIAGGAAAVNSTAGRLVEAMLWGMLDEYKAEKSDRGAQAWDRIKEAATSPFTFLKNYWWGFVKGVFSPITGLFDLAKLAVKLEALQMQIMASAWRNREAIALEAGQLAASLNELGPAGKNAVKGLMAHPIETIKALDGWLTTLGNEAEARARSGGHEVMKMLLGALDKPMPELAELAGEIVGAVLVNIALLVFTEGIGNAIEEIAVQLGKLGSFLGKFGEAAAMMGRLITKISELLGFVGGWIAKAEALIAKAAEAVLKPVAPLLKQLENVVTGLRSFLRRLLGLAEKEATSAVEATAGATGKQLESHVPTSTPTVKPPPVHTPTPTTPPKVVPRSTGAGAVEEGAESLGTKGAAKAGAEAPPSGPTTRSASTEAPPPTPTTRPRSKVFDGISKETEATLAKRPALEKALADHPKAADLFKLCKSECFPSFLTDEEMLERLVALERMQAEAERYGVEFNRGAVKELLHKQKSVADIDAALESIKDGLRIRIRASWQPTPGGEPPNPLAGPSTKMPPRAKTPSDAPTQFGDMPQKPPAGAEDLFEQPGMNQTKTPGGKPENPKTFTGKFVDRNIELLQNDPKILEDMARRGFGGKKIFSQDLPTGLEAEFRIPHKKFPPGQEPRIDRLWRKGDTIFELKPNTKAAELGEGQAKTYAELMDRVEPLKPPAKWKSVVVTYDQTALMEYLRSIGVLK